MSGPIRVVVAKPGLDGHDRGAKIIARSLRDAGMEVIYTGLHQTPEQIVATVLQEDADAVGISILSGAHMTLVPRILDLLRERGAGDVVVVVGGTIPGEDVVELKALGVAEVFTPGAPTAAIVEFLRDERGGGGMSGAGLRIAIDGRVATVTIDRPDVLNALNTALLEELLATLTDLGADSGGRASSCSPARASARSSPAPTSRRWPARRRSRRGPTRSSARRSPTSSRRCASRRSRR